MGDPLRSTQNSGQTSALDTAMPLILLSLVLMLGFSTVRPFLPAMLWGVFLGVALLPFYHRVVDMLGGRRGLASIAVGAFLALVLVVPIVGLSRSLIAFIPDVLVWISEEGTTLIDPAGPSVEVERNLFSGEIKSIWDTLLRDLQFIRDHFGAELRPAVLWLIQEGRLVGVFMAEFALGVLLATVVLYHAEALGQATERSLGRIGGAFAADLGRKAVTTVRSTVLGLLGSAAAQTAVASFAYVIADVPHWPILAMLTFMLGLVQVGPIVAWLPVSIWLWSNEQIGMAVFVTLWGLVVVGLTDNLVKSLVVARGADVPALIAFFGAVGGLLTWGVVGIFLGPVILAVCYQLMLGWLGRDVRDAPPYDPPPKG